MAQSQKTILFVGGGIEAIPGVKLAKSLNLFVVVSDKNPNAPCKKVADAFIVADTYNISDTIDKATNFHLNIRNIDGVICMASDIPLTVSSVAKALNLEGIPLTAAKIVSDKVLMKDCFKKAGLPIPKYQQISHFMELKKIIRNFNFPIVLKPVDSRGARGVLKIDSDKNLNSLYLISKSYSPKGIVIVEEYLSGPQLSTESLIVDERVFTVGFSDRNYEFLEKFSPYIIENGGDLPSLLPKFDQDQIKETVEKTANALGIKNGVIKGDMVLSNGKPYIIEVAARLSGGYFCSHEIPLNTGVDFVGNAIKLALGITIDINELTPKTNNAVSQRYIFPIPGKVIKIKIPDWVKEDKRVSMCEIRVKVGDIIPKAIHHPARAGVVICCETSNDKAKFLAERVVNEIIIETI